MRKLILIAAVAGLLVTSLLLASVASAQQSVEVSVTVTEFKVVMSTTTIPANTPVKFVVTNKGAIAHEIVLEKAGAVDEPLELAGAEAEIEDIEAGATKSAVWTISEAGEFQLACHVPGHFEAGMLQTFSVAASAAAAPATLPVSGGLDSSVAAVLLVGLGLLIVLTALALRRRLA